MAVEPGGGVRLARLLGGDFGWAGAVGTLLLAALGLVVMLRGAMELRQVAQVKPEVRTCAEWRRDPAGPRWVSLTQCELEPRELRVGSGSARYLSLGTRGEAPVLLEVTDAQVLALLDAAHALPQKDAEAYLAAHAAELRLVTRPATLAGWLAPLAEDVTPAAPGAMVLRLGAQPPRGQVVLRLVVGILALALALRPLGRRYLLSREGEATPGGPGDAP